MKSLIDLEPNDCRYPIGEENFQFCAAPKHVYLREGKMCVSPYCHEHFLICTVEPYVRRVAA